MVVKNMVYIRPPARIPPAVTLKPIGSNEPVQEQHLEPAKPTEAPLTPAPSTERRKRHDRRDRGKKSSDPLLETRTSNDRRKSNKPTISITV